MNIHDFGGSFMRSRFTSLVLVALATTLAACDDDDATSPSALARLDSRSTGANGDSASAPTVGSLDLRGTVYQMSVRTPVVAGQDSLVRTPLAGATIELRRNLLVDGKATQTVVGTVTSAADGSYSFTGLAGGYYVAYGYPPAGSALTETLEYVAGTQAQVTTNLFMWKGQ